MLNISKLTKRELIAKYRVLDKESARYAKAADIDVENAKNEAMTAHRLKEKAEEKISNQNVRIKNLNAQIERIHQSLQTVVRMKYPMDGIYRGSSDMKASATDEPREVVKPTEELNLLKYLIQLCIVQGPTDISEMFW
ncbi:MAG: hypothetical protein CMB80_01915 [Flammeovirgaceae bacterium]|nr:hypothetical protein [Flammeovirgaceae bacterium]